MEKLGDILKQKKFAAVSRSTRPINSRWELAQEFGEYVGLKTLFVLKLFKLYGMERVLGLRSWLKDCPHDPKKYAGLVVWKLKKQQS